MCQQERYYLTKNDIILLLNKILNNGNIPLAPFSLSHFQVGVKSVWHWLQLNGIGCGPGGLSSFKYLLTHSSSPSRYMNSELVGFGMKCISGGGGLGGGICNYKHYYCYLYKLDVEIIITC